MFSNILLIVNIIITILLNISRGIRWSSTAGTASWGRRAAGRSRGRAQIIIVAILIIIVITLLQRYTVISILLLLLLVVVVVYIIVVLFIILLLLIIIMIMIIIIIIIIIMIILMMMMMMMMMMMRMIIIVIIIIIIIVIIVEHERPGADVRRETPIRQFQVSQQPVCEKPNSPLDWMWEQRIRGGYYNLFL